MMEKIYRYEAKYASEHTDDDCDKCRKRIGRQNLIRVPFIYKDMNDKDHQDLGHGYRQYYICSECKP